MGKAEPALLSLAESVADGSSVDWHEAEANATTDEQTVIRQLRVLASLAAIHRALPEDEASGAAAHARRGSGPAIGSWADLSLVERLGGGTFGEVYRAWDRNLEREVALKLLRLGEVSDDPQSSRIVREGRLLARMRHPNVITVHSVEIHEGRVGLCMELVRGTTLEDVLRTSGSFSAREAALVGIDLCRALAAIHAAGLIHRDVKAQNVMRGDGGRIVLMDLGTGREVQSTEHALPDLVGTPLYLAPEIFDGAPASERTDLYSVGVLLYHLVTGSFPVPAGTVDELRDAHGRGTTVRLRDARADLPTAFVRVVDRAVSRDPARRYASAGELEADLADALHTNTGSAAPAADRVGMRTIGIAAALVLAVAVGMLGWRNFRAGGAAGSIRSIAVLPLANLSNNTTQDYFADGMTDELIATLSRLDGINVISRTSAMQFKGSKLPLPDIARALRADAVLEGSVLVDSRADSAGPASQHVRINARLIHAGSDTLVWDKTFERVLADVLALQREVAKAVADGIHLRLSSRQRAFLAEPGADVARLQDVEAFDLYLRGRYYCNMRTEQGLTQSTLYFQAAIDRNPQYALAYSGLADAYYLLSEYGFLPRTIALVRASAAASRAIELDGSLAAAHTSLAQIHQQQYEWDAAEAEFKTAIELEPGYATAHHWYSTYLVRRARFAEASDEIAKALVLDPLSITINSHPGWALIFERRYDEAIDHLERSMLLMSDRRGRIHTLLAEAYAHKGDYDRALAEAQTAAPLTGSSPEVPAVVGYIHARSGRRAEALQVAADLAARYERSNDETAGAVAAIYASLGDVDRAIEWLERSFQRREDLVGFLLVDPRFDPLRSDPRFAKLLANVGLAR